jgi:hypothetical protein
MRFDGLPSIAIAARKGIWVCGWWSMANIDSVCALRNIESAMKLGSDPKKWLQKKAKKGVRSYPVGTIAFYGPDNQRVSKVVAAVIIVSGGEAEPIRKWFDDALDLRFDDRVLEEAAAFFKEQGVHSVAMTDSIIGCPHEEDIDYPLGEKCPHCPFWAIRDRWTHEAVQ